MEDHNRSACSQNGQVMMKMENYFEACKPYEPTRCYSASYKQTQAGPKDLKKAKSICMSWSFTDAELQRKKRVATYKIYCVESKAKGSLWKGFKWLKDKYSQAVYGCS